MRYPVIYNGQWIEPEHEGFQLKCCDCGVVHRINFRIVSIGRARQVLMQMFRLARATAAVRASKAWKAEH